MKSEREIKQGLVRAMLRNEALTDRLWREHPDSDAEHYERRCAAGERLIEAYISVTGDESPMYSDAWRDNA